jgi:diketogulonate reductase-like aldo/keto reductase
MAKVFQAMQGLVRKGKILRAGVSNFGIRHLEDLRKKKYIPYANQVEFHPYLYQKELLKYCHSHRIECVAYRPLGKKKLLKEQLFKRIAEKHGKSAAQIILRWCIQKKCTVIPKSSSKTHLMENLEIFDFSLSAAEMKLLDALHRNKRFCGENDPEFDY